MPIKYRLCCLLLALLPPISSAQGLTPLVNPVQGIIISEFNQKTDFYYPGAGYNNPGVNFFKESGTSVLAAYQGEVGYTGEGFPIWGKVVILLHEEEWMTVYAHLDAIFVSQGEEVDQNHVIGTVGMTGAATQPQLHFQILKNGQPLDPERFLP